MRPTRFSRPASGSRAPGPFTVGFTNCDLSVDSVGLLRNPGIRDRLAGFKLLLKHNSTQIVPAPVTRLMTRLT